MAADLLGSQIVTVVSKTLGGLYKGCPGRADLLTRMHLPARGRIPIVGDDSAMARVLPVLSALVSREHPLGLRDCGYTVMYGCRSNHPASDRHRDLAGEIDNLYRLVRIHLVTLFVLSRPDLARPEGTIEIHARRDNLVLQPNDNLWDSGNNNTVLRFVNTAHKPCRAMIRVDGGRMSVGYKIDGASIATSQRFSGFEDIVNEWHDVLVRGAARRACRNQVIGPRGAPCFPLVLADLVADLAEEGPEDSMALQKLVPLRYVFL